MAHARGLGPEGVPFAGFRYMRIRIAQVWLNEGVGKSSFVYQKGA